jgi:hypothetical protein
VQVGEGEAGDAETRPFRGLAQVESRFGHLLASVA